MHYQIQVNTLFPVYMWISKPRKNIVKLLDVLLKGLCIELAGKLLPDGLRKEPLQVISAQKYFSQLMLL